MINICTIYNLPGTNSSPPDEAKKMKNAPIGPPPPSSASQRGRKKKAPVEEKGPEDGVIWYDGEECDYEECKRPERQKNRKKAVEWVSKTSSYL